MAHCSCNGCGFVMLMTERATQDKPLCPKCGEKHFTMTFHSTLELLPNNTTRVKQKDLHYKSDKKLRREHFVGMEANAIGVQMIKERLIDKDADIYYECVIDPSSDEVVRYCDEKLTEHRGRGSARRRKNDDGT